MTLHLSRRAPRRVLAAALGLSMTVGLAACSSDESDNSSDASSAGTADSATAPEGYYPHTLTTAHGNTTIEAQPERIIAMTVNIADELLALGITPIAVATDPSQLDTYFPWIADDIRDISDADLAANQKINIEKIADLDPDLVIGSSYQFRDKSAWEKTTAVAPTVIPKSGDINVGWETSLTTTAEALGLQDKAKGINTEIKQAYKDVAGGLPAGKTYNFAAFSVENDFRFGNGSLFEMFGLTPASSQRNAQGHGLSVENANELTGDLLVVAASAPGARTKLDEISTFKNLPAVKNGTVYYADAQDANAINSASPRSLRWFLDRITPTIEKLK